MTDDLHPNGEAPTESPATGIDRLAVRLDGVQRRAVGEAIEYASAGVVFAVREADLLSFRLRDDVAKAALQTPDTAPSVRGSDWVALTPSTADTFTLDRAAAWFESAWRLAGSGSEGPQPG